MKYVLLSSILLSAIFFSQGRSGPFRTLAPFIRPTNSPEGKIAEQRLDKVISTFSDAVKGELRRSRILDTLFYPQSVHAVWTTLSPDAKEAVRKVAHIVSTFSVSLKKELMRTGTIDTLIRVRALEKLF
ncbi:hypothetical protein PFISCL1PPCAC_26336 [Pristionchus fissidentatus]|uniref:Uncharacterized protein n=1 Tax=Pristionchus fissidentatus TaxID=1538716 RepID=A0AAV5WWL4_9BILA|nr:hypothetical protein PFISCL1PPCAC_26336 [Pristionchus fissidentatus]